MPLPASDYTPQLNTGSRLLVSWLIITAGALFFCMLIVAAPLAAASNHSSSASTIYRGFSSLCHQLPDRSFFISEHQFAVCSRCTGLYAGFAFILLLYPLIRSLRTTVTPPRKWLFLAAIPMTVDFNLTFFGLWENTHSSRFLTGLLLGSVAVLYVMPGLSELISRRGRTGSTAVESGTRFTLASVESNAAAPSDYSAPERRI